jgi:hypothetical protein
VSAWWQEGIEDSGNRGGRRPTQSLKSAVCFPSIRNGRQAGGLELVVLAPCTLFLSLLLRWKCLVSAIYELNQRDHKQIEPGQLLLASLSQLSDRAWNLANLKYSSQMIPMISGLVDHMRNRNTTLFPRSLVFQKQQ